MFAGYPHDRWYRFFSGIVIVSYLTLALLYMLVIPVGESPDEPSHLQCIEQVSLRNRIPVIDPRPQGTVWWAREAHHLRPGLLPHAPLLFVGRLHSKTGPLDLGHADPLRISGK